MKNPFSRNKKSSGIVLLFLVFFLVSSLSILVPQVQATDWLTGWTYRKSHIITHSADSGTNYQMKITVYYGSGTDSGGNVYSSSHCVTDFSDIRFTDDGGSTQLDYWMESSAVSDNAVFWVEVAADLSTNDQTIYLYYGNSTTATTTSNGPNTFPFFDDFSGTLSDKWTETGTGTAANSEGECTITSGEYNKFKGIQGKTNYGYNYSARTRSKTVSGNYIWYDSFSNYPTSNNYAVLFADVSNGLCSQMEDGATDNYTSGNGTTTYTIWEVDRFSATSCKTYVNDTLFKAHTAHVPTASYPIDFQTFSSAVMKVDWALVRKCVTTEPTHSTWGSEATPDTTAPTATVPATPYNTTIAGTAANFSCQWSDETALSKATLETNNTGAFANQTWITLSGTGPSWANFTVTLNATAGRVVQYKWHCNDTTNNMEQTNSSGVYMNITLTVATTYSQTPGASGDDGYVYSYNQAVYANAQTTPYSSDNTTSNFYVGQSKYILYQVFRSFLKFDTSTIPSNATITAAKLCLRGHVAYDYSTTDFNINLQKWTGDTPITTDDFMNYDNVNYDSTWNTGSYITGYNNITISNFTLITKGGNTLICVRSSRDVGSTPPTGEEYVMFYSYDGTARPLLEVTYGSAFINTVPTMQTPLVSSTVYAYQQVTVATVLNDPDGAYSVNGGLLNCTLTMNASSVTLNWLASGNTTSKTDPNNCWVLDSSSTTTVNSTAVNVTWTVRLYWNSTKGAYGITGIVYDQAGENGTSTDGSFTFVDDLIVASSPSFNETRCDPSTSVLLSGQLYYSGTSIPPYNSTGITAYCELNATSKGSNSSIASDGTFQITITSEASPIGTYSYNAYALTDEITLTNRTVTIIVEQILVESGGAPSSTVHVGDDTLIYYVLKYETDSALVTDGSVLLNGSDMTYSVGNGRWERNVTSLTLGNFSYSVSMVSGNLYGITTLNDTVGLETCSFYVNVNARVIDVDGDPLTDAIAIVYMNNGTLATGIPSGLPSGTGVAVIGVTEWTSTTVSASGWANWTGFTNSSVQFYVLWHGLTVNTTFTATLTTDLDLNISLLCYPYAVNGLDCWAASNATISTWSFASDILTVDFSSATANYIFVAGSSVQPAYILNCTYDYSTDFTTYLTLVHYGNCTLTLSYEATWGDVYVQSTSHRLTTASFTGYTVSLDTTGTDGSGLLLLYCGARGEPQTVTGFVTAAYAGKVLTGDYVVEASVTLTVQWGGGYNPGGAGGGGGGDIYDPTALIVEILFGFPKTVDKSTVVNGTLNVTWSGLPQCYLIDVQVNPAFGGWRIILPGMPIPLNFENGTATLQVQVVVPSNASEGVTLLPCSVSFTVSGGAKVVTSLVRFEVPGGAVVLPSIPDVLTYSFVAMLGMVAIGVPIFRKKRRGRTEP